MSRFVILLLLPFPLFAVPSLQSSETVSTTGTFRLSWESDGPWLVRGNKTYVLEECSTSGCHAVYKGHDRSTVMSGRPDGTYRFRLSEAGVSNASSETTVEVRHHPLGRSLAVLTVGFALFLLCAAALVGGEMRIKRRARKVEGGL